MQTCVYTFSTSFFPCLRCRKDPRPRNKNTIEWIAVVVCFFFFLGWYDSIMSHPSTLGLKLRPKYCSTYYISQYCLLHLSHLCSSIPLLMMMLLIMLMMLTLLLMRICMYLHTIRVRSYVVWYGVYFVLFWLMPPRFVFTFGFSASTLGSFTLFIDCSWSGSKGISISYPSSHPFSSLYALSSSSAFLKSAYERHSLYLLPS